MTRPRSRLVLALLAVLLVGGLAGYLFVPPAGAGDPSSQPYQLHHDDVGPSTYRVTANASLTCRNGSRAVAVTQRQVARVDRDAEVWRSRRVVETDDRRLTFGRYVHGTEEYRRTVNATGPPTFEHDPFVPAVGPDLLDYQAVFRRLLRFEWRVVEEGGPRHVLAPRAGYWVGPATIYGVRSRVYVANASGRLVVSDEGVLRDLTLSATTVRAETRFERLTGDGDRCSVSLGFHREPAAGPVEPPDWLPAARNATADG